MGKIIKFPIPTPEKFGPQRVRKRKESRRNQNGQLNLFSGGKVIKLNQLTSFEEALLLDEQGNKQRAKVGYLQAIDQEDSIADAYCNLGIIESLEGTHPKAIDYFTRCLKAEPRHFEAHYNLANLYAEIGNFSLAKAHYEIAIQLESSFPNSYFNLGLTLAMNKEFEKAVKVLNQFRKIAPIEDQKLADDMIEKLRSAL
ncbi:MAG TPA: tetratricopeptide repeat protein [Chryseolinea sp.]|nr:tetratricopeptide repeat protein [Chryseolinea sp.]